MQTTSLNHHQLNAAVVARWLLVTALIGCLLGLGTAPAHARYGYSIRSAISSGDSGWLWGGYDTVPSVTRRVQPGHGVTFGIQGRGSGDPAVPDPVVKGCDSAGGIDVRYILETDGGDDDITAAVTGHRWTDPDAGKRWWRVDIRLAVRVGSKVAHGSSLSCRVTVNGDPVRANVEVA
jgi:hypothetical protein